MNVKRLLSAVAVGACLFAVSCQKEADYESSLPPLGKKVSFCILEEDPETVETKSLLTDASIETKRTGVVVALFRDGSLVDRTYLTSFSGITFSLEYGGTYRLYALVNMGDIRSSIPSAESGMSSLVYSIPSYTGGGQSVNNLGIPMAGYLDYTVGTSSVTDIPVKRLLAKVTAVLSCDWNGAKITSAKVFNMNKYLKPFGTSAASSSSDMLDFQEVEMAPGVGTASLTGVFYVPENMQGTVSGISVSDNKAGDKNATVGANASKLTYLQVAVESEGKYDGDIVYRSYLGNNVTTNFDIQRNYRYVWTIHFQSDKVDDFNDDWKHDFDGLEIVDYSLSLSPDPKTISSGENFAYTTTLHRNVIKPSASSTSSVLDNSDATWSSSNTEVATVSSSGVVTGVAAGTASITARYTPAGSDLSERTATASVTVQNIAYEVEVSALTGTTGLKHNETATLKAMYYVVTNGVRDAGTDVTASAIWSQSGGSKYGVASGVVRAYATSGAPSVEGTTSVTATYNSIASNSVDVSFVDITSGTVTVSPSSASGTYVSPAVFTANYVGTVNGYTTSDIDVTSTATWSATGAKYSVTNGSVSADASIGDHSVAGTSTVTAVYGGTTSNSVTATFTDFVENNVVVSPASGTIQAGGANVNLTARYVTVTNSYQTGNVDITTNGFNDWSSNNVNVTVGEHTGVVSANLSASGIAVITATYSGKSGSCTLTVSDAVISHSLEVTPSSSSANVGQTIELTARYYTTTNGVKDSGVDVTTNSGTSWSRVSGASTVIVNNTGSYKGDVTATAGGTATIQASYAGETGTATVTFNDVITYELEVTGSSSANVGETIALTSTFYTLTNGSRNGGDVVTTSSNWSRSGGSAYVSVNDSGLDKGKVTASAAGTAIIQAAYTHSGTPYYASKEVSFGNVDVEKYRIVISPASVTIDYGSTQTFTVNRYTDVYRNGSLYSSGTTPSVMSSSSFNWSSSATGVATVNASGVASGVGTGSSTISATLKSGVTDYAKYTNTSVSATLTVNTVTSHRLTLAADNASVPYNGTINLTAKYYTTTNGVEDSGVEVTPSSLSKTSGGSNITLSAGNPSTAVLTNPSLSVVSNNRATVTASYAGETSDGVFIQFTNVTTYGYTRLVVSGDSNVNVGAITGNYSATLYTQTYVNGVASGSASSSDVSSSASFASSNTSVATMSGRKATGVAAGTTYISASYSGTYGSVTSTGSDRKLLTVNNVVSHRLEIIPSSSSAMKGETISLVAKYYTTTNGVEDSGVVVTTDSGTAWSKPSGSSSVSVNNTGSNKGKVTATSYGSATIQASYEGESAMATVSFSAYRFKVSPASASLGIGYEKTFTVYRYLVSSTGAESGETAMANSNFNWSSSATSKATVNSSGKVFGVAVGSATITATLKSGITDHAKFVNTTATSSITVISGGGSWDDDWDDGGETGLE